MVPRANSLQLAVAAAAAVVGTAPRCSYWTSQCGRTRSPGGFARAECHGPFHRTPFSRRSVIVWCCCDQVCSGLSRALRTMSGSRFGISPIPSP